MNLFEKIVEVRKSIEGFGKDKKGYGYEYVSGNQVLSKIKDKMNELKLILSPSCLTSNHETFEYRNNKGEEKTDFIVWGEMEYKWIDAENNEERRETLREKWQYYGQQDDISKAFGSALTYSERYYLLKFFGIPTDADDPDSKDTSGKGSKYDANTYTFTFGKYKGKKLSEIKDDDYLKWIINDTQDAKLRSMLSEWLMKDVNKGFEKTVNGLKS